MTQILLASQSPRRKELLKGLNIPFNVVNVDHTEQYPSDLEPQEIPVYVAREKAQVYLQTQKLPTDTILLTADTIVHIGKRILGKPKDILEAKDMLLLLQGKEHIVTTGVCLCKGDKQDSFSVNTTVHFRTLTMQQIDFYVTNFPPLDKAGAYGIQDWIGYVGIDYIHGDYYNVMGLPMSELYKHLQVFL